VGVVHHHDLVQAQRSTYELLLDLGDTLLFLVGEHRLTPRPEHVGADLVTRDGDSLGVPTLDELQRPRGLAATAVASGDDEMTRHFSSCSRSERAKSLPQVVNQTLKPINAVVDLP